MTNLGGGQSLTAWQRAGSLLQPVLFAGVMLGELVELMQLKLRRLWGAPETPPVPLVSPHRYLGLGSRKTQEPSGVQPQ